MTDRSSLILAGGRGKRMGQREKALIPFRGKTIIEHTIDVVKDVVEEIVVSLRNEEQKTLLSRYVGGSTMVADRHSDLGPLAGILEGFRAAEGEYVFVSACDMPHLNASVIEFLFKHAKGHDAAVPVWENEMMEPLHAVYHRETMLSEAKKAIDCSDMAVLSLVFELDDVVLVEMDKIREIDRELKTFTNINTTEDLNELEICYAR